MTDHSKMPRTDIDVAIIGGGPAGLSAAIELKRRGVQGIVVLDRERQAGGIPRHCGHPPFGMREFKRVLTGPKYAEKLVKTAIGIGVEIRTSTTVVEARPGGELLIATSQGLSVINARRVIYATGVRETPRSARLISGKRPLGVINTGALQSMVYLENRKPFERPVIIGTELVAISAIGTCRHAKIRPVAMIEERRRVTARWPFSLYPRLTRVPLHLNTKLLAINGDKNVTSIEVEDRKGTRRTIECDGVLLCGRFTPEASLALCGHLEIAPLSNGPLVDQFGRCSDPVYFAAGNVLRPVETAGWSWSEGKATGGRVADDLAGKLPEPEVVLQITSNDPLIKLFMPQKITLPHTGTAMKDLQLRFNSSAKGQLIAHQGEHILWQRPLNAHPERRFLLPIKALIAERKTARDKPIELSFEVSK